jgi:hypothetical protein
VSWLRLRGVQPKIDPFDAHFPPQRLDVQTSHLEAISLDQPLKYATVGKRMVEVQYVDPAHQS